MQKILLRRKYFKRGLSKKCKKFFKERFFLSNLVTFYRQLNKIQKSSGTSYQSIFRFQKKPFPMIYHLEKFAYLTVSGLWTIPKITFANLCRPIHDGIIILVSPGPLNLKFVHRKGKKNRKIWIFWVWKELFTEHTKIFFISLKCFLLVKYKK